MLQMGNRSEIDIVKPVLLQIKKDIYTKAFSTTLNSFLYNIYNRVKLNK